MVIKENEARAALLLGLPRLISFSGLFRLREKP
jgi:hypothetical protein